MNMAKRPVEKYDFKAFGQAIKAARTKKKKGQHPSLQIFFELMLRYDISVDQFLLEKPDTKNTQRRQLDTLLDTMSDKGIRIVTATAKEIKEVEKEDK